LDRDKLDRGGVTMKNTQLQYIDEQPVRLLVSASPNQPANSVFLSQKTSTNQPKPAPAPTSEQAHCVYYVSFLDNE